jgi:hypothetical protein
MKVDWTKTVEGVPLKIVRDMMRDLRRGHPTRQRIADTTCEHIVPPLVERSGLAGALIGGC